VEAGDIVDQRQLGQQILEMAPFLPVRRPRDEFPERLEGEPEALIGVGEPGILAATHGGTFYQTIESKIEPVSYTAGPPGRVAP